jgi:hypothetical protein
LPARDFQLSRVKLKWVADDFIENEVPTDVATEPFKQTIPVQGKVRVGTGDLLARDALYSLKMETVIYWSGGELRTWTALVLLVLSSSAIVTRVFAAMGTGL